MVKNEGESLSSCMFLCALLKRLFSSLPQFSPITTILSMIKFQRRHKNGSIIVSKPFLFSFLMMKKSKKQGGNSLEQQKIWLRKKKWGRKMLKFLTVIFWWFLLLFFVEADNIRCDQKCSKNELICFVFFNVP